MLGKSREKDVMCVDERYSTRDDRQIRKEADAFRVQASELDWERAYHALKTAEHKRLLPRLSALRFQKPYAQFLIWSR